MVYQNEAFTLNFIMKDAVGARLTSLQTTDITVNVAKPGAGGFVVTPNTAFTEIGLGYYSVTIPATFTDIVGEVLFVVEGTGAVDFERSLFVEPSPLAAVGNNEVCRVFGNIKDIAGRPAPGNCPIVVRGEDTPLVVANGFISNNKVTTMPNADGDFSIDILRNQRVSFQIENASIKKIVITVPDQATANLADLIPQ